MYDRKHRIQVAFDAETVAEATGMSLDPDTFEEHLDFAVNYQLAMYRMSSRDKREQTRPHVVSSLSSRYSLMELRALFLFANAEHKAEIVKGGRLNELERGELWVQLADDELIDFPERGASPVATDKSITIKYGD